MPPGDNPIAVKKYYYYYYYYVWGKPPGSILNLKSRGIQSLSRGTSK